MDVMHFIYLKFQLLTSELNHDKVHLLNTAFVNIIKMFQFMVFIFLLSIINII